MLCPEGERQHWQRQTADLPDVDGILATTDKMWHKTFYPQRFVVIIFGLTESRVNVQS